MKTKKFALNLGTLPPETVLADAVLAERSGFDCITSSDHIVMPLAKICYEAWSTLSAVAALTFNVLIGTTVSDPHRSHPAILAQQVATIDHISKGRAFLGLGTGEAMNTKPYGIEMGRPLAKLREAVEVIRLFWTGRQIDYHGQFFKLSKARIQITPIQPTLPILISGMGPRSRELAGEIGDGWVLAYASPSLVRDKFNDVLRGRQKARKEGDFEIFCKASASISRREDEKTDKTMRERIALGLLWFPTVLEYFGVERVEQMDAMHYTLNESAKQFSELDKGLRDKLMTIVDQITIFGTPAECIEKFQAYFDAGVTTLGLTFRHDILDETSEIKLFKERVKPYFDQEFKQ